MQQSMNQQPILQSMNLQSMGEQYDSFLEQNANPHYTGEYNDNGQMHGIGSIKRYLSGYEYEGEFKDGAMTGTGVFNWENGDSYTGDVLNGILHGYGIIYYSSGCTYEGTWRNNCKHGTGIYFYTSGDTYDGEWKNGAKDGKGVFRNRDRKVIYDGEWKDDNRTGYGILYNLEDETKIEGYFYNGIPVNEFVYEFNQEHGTGFTNWEYDQFLTYMENSNLEVADALAQDQRRRDYDERNGGYGGNDGCYMGGDTEEDFDAEEYSDAEDVAANAVDSVQKYVAANAEEEDAAYDSDEEDELIPLRDMTDKQIDRYIDMLGSEPRDECKEWSRDFNGGAITRYSYINFDNTTIADRSVLNRTIRRAKFSGCTLRNVKFEQVHFHESNFMSVILENVRFKDCQFTDCDLDICMDLDNSCSVENNDCDFEDQVVYRYC
jgi:hypothetical protein